MNFTTLSSIASIAFGGILINTLPIWLGEIASAHSLKIDDVGILATVTMLTAGVGCLVHSVWRTWFSDILFAMIVTILTIVLREPEIIESAYIFAACGVLGWSTGTILARGIEDAFSRPNPLLVISPGMTIGFGLSLVAILVNAGAEISILWLIAFFAFITLILLGKASAKGLQKNVSFTISKIVLCWSDLLFLPFFVAMGGLCRAVQR